MAAAGRAGYLVRRGNGLGLRREARGRMAAAGSVIRISGRFVEDVDGSGAISIAREQAQRVCAWAVVPSRLT